MRNTTRMTSRKSRLLALSVAAVSQALLAPYGPQSAFAAPQGAHAIRGNVSITQSGDTTIITASNHSIINFSSFDIAKGEKVQIIEPNSHSRILERVVGRSPTLIDGSLIANGQVFLVNPLGISFGSSATINVAGLTAIAGELSNADFLSHNNRFTNLTGPVSNDGHIVSSGPTALIGQSVANTGSIVAGSSTVVLAAGSQVFVGNHGSGIYARVTGQADSLAATVAGSGDIYSLALGHHSQIQAGNVVVNGAGNVQVSGSLDASSAAAGTTGGSVAVTGKNVQLSGAKVNASGAAGGGTIQVGGGFHGQGDVQAARTTTISADSTLQADALVDGQGGRVAVWSTQTTDFAGTIRARGAGSGAGGFAEVSSGQTLKYAGTADLSGPGGFGSLLLDPANFTIAPSGGDMTGTQVAANVATANVVLTATTEIFVHDVVNISGTPNTLTLDAPTIDFTMPITLRAPGQLIGGASVTTANVHAGGLIQNGVDVLPAAGGSLLIDPALYTDNVSISTKTISVTNTGSATSGFVQANSWTVASPITLNGKFSAAGTAGFTFTAAAPVTLGGNTSLQTSAAPISFGGTVNGAFSLTLNSAGGSEVFSQAVGNTTPLTSLNIVSSGGATTLAGAQVNTTGGQTYGDAVVTTGAALTLLDTTGAITFSNALTGATTALIANGAGGNIFKGTVTLKSLDARGAGGTTLGGTAVNTTAGQTYENAVSTTGAALTLTDTTGAITFSNTLTGATTALTSNGAGGNIFDGAILLKSLDAKGAGGTTLATSTVNTSAGQTYEDAVVTSVPTLTLSDSAGVITFSNTFTGTATALNVSGSGGNAFFNTVTAKSLTTSGGGTKFNVAGTAAAVLVTTTAGQTYNDVVTVTSGSLAASSFNDSSGRITFKQTLQGTLASVTVNGAGGNEFDGGISLRSLTAKGNGGTRISGVQVVTTAGQTYLDAVTLGGSTSLAFTDTKGTITFSRTVTGVLDTPVTLTGHFIVDDRFSNAKSITFGVPSTISGPGPVVSATHIGTSGQNFGSTNTQFQSPNAADAGQFGSNFTLFNGDRNVNLATILTDVLPIEPPLSQGSTAAITPAEQRELESIGIFVKSPDAVAADLDGQSSQSLIINDWPGIHGARPSDRRLTPRRLDERKVKAVVYDLEQVNGPNKKQVTAQIAATVAAYRAQAGPDNQTVTPAAFARFVTRGASAQQRAAIYRLRKLADEIDALGLSPAEAQAANQTWSYDLTPDDQGLVNRSGQPDNRWLLDALDDLPPTVTR